MKMGCQKVYARQKCCVYSPSKNDLPVLFSVYIYKEIVVAASLKTIIMEIEKTFLIIVAQSSNCSNNKLEFKKN
jgi:hypothetical protein